MKDKIQKEQYSSQHKNLHICMIFSYVSVESNGKSFWVVSVITQTISIEESQYQGRNKARQKVFQQNCILKLNVEHRRSRLALKQYYFSKKPGTPQFLRYMPNSYKTTLCNPKFNVQTHLFPFSQQSFKNYFKKNKQK